MTNSFPVSFVTISGDQMCVYSWVHHGERAGKGNEYNTAVRVELTLCNKQMRQKSLPDFFSQYPSADNYQFVVSSFQWECFTAQCLTFKTFMYSFSELFWMFLSKQRNNSEYHDNVFCNEKFQQSILCIFRSMHMHRNILKLKDMS